MNEAWFSSTLFPRSVRVSLPRERMVKEQGLFPGLTKPKLYARTTSKVSIIAPVEGLCCKPIYRANLILFSFVIFPITLRKDQFTALILKFGIQTKKVQPWTPRGLIVLYSSFSLKDSLQWSENWTRLIPEEQTSYSLTKTVVCSFVVQELDSAIYAR